MKLNKKIIVGVIVVTVFLLAILLFAIIYFRKDEKNNFLEEAVEMEREEAALLETEEYYDLSSQGELERDVVLEGQEIIMLSDSFKTNSTEIIVKNKADFPIKVYLYNILYTEDTIQEMNIDSLKTGVFTNLSSVNLYKIGIASTEDIQCKIVISDE